MDLQVRVGNRLVLLGLKLQAFILHLISLVQMSNAGVRPFPCLHCSHSEAPPDPL